MSAQQEQDADAAVRQLKRMDQSARLTGMEELRRSVATSLPPAPQMDWTDLKTIDQDGLMSIEDHSYGHPQLDRCPPQEVREEIGRSVEMFEQQLGRRPRAFAYPDGAWSDEAAGALASQGYQGAFLFDHRRASIQDGDRWGISRLRVNSTTSLDRFATILSGLHPALHHLRGRR
jgi:peptidoglycan/xylan/chitin deacetylase (PgdA/CDA1 family)